MLFVDSCRRIGRHIVVCHCGISSIAHAAFRRSQLAIRILHVADMPHSRLRDRLTVRGVHLRGAGHVDVVLNHTAVLLFEFARQGGLVLRSLLVCVGAGVIIIRILGARNIEWVISLHQ